MATAALTRPTNSASDHTSLGEFPVANVRKPGDFPREEFVLVPNVPVFAEHETVTRAGKPIKFGVEELSKIVDRCNRRIDETGDYAAITAGHTPGPEAAERGAPQPDVLGYAGPFRLGVLGMKDGSKRWAILADEHVYRDEYARWRKLSRRSPEVWLEDRFEEMFLDPIAHLGAEAPRLDMGLLYAASKSGRQVEKYAAVAAASPSASSVFIPSAVDSREPEKHRYAEGDSGFSDAVPVQAPARAQRESEGAAMLQAEDIEQIVDAMDRLPWVGWVKQKMQEEAAPGPGAMTPGAVDEPAAAGGETGPAPAGVGGDSPTPPKAPSPSPGEPGDKLKDAADAGGAAKVDYPASPAKFAAAKFAAGEGENEEEKREREEYARMHAKYGADEGVKRYAALHRKYAADDAAGAYQETPPGGSRETVNIPPGGAEVSKNSAENRYGHKRHYEAGSAGGNNPNKPAEGTADEGNNNPGDGSAAGPTSDGAEPYRRGGQRETYAQHDYVLRLEREVQTTRQQLSDMQARNVNNERYARLQGLRQHFVFDVDRTVELTKYGKMDDAMFEAQCELIEANGRVVPANQPWLPGSEEPPQSPLNGSAPGRAAPAKYSKAVSDRALQLCEAAAAAGKQPSYERVLSDLHAGREPVF